MNFSIWLQDSKYRNILKIDDKKAKNITDKELIRRQEAKIKLLELEVELLKKNRLERMGADRKSKTEK